MCIHWLHYVIMKDVGLRIRVQRELRESFLEACRAEDKLAACWFSSRSAPIITELPHLIASAVGTGANLAGYCPMVAKAGDAETPTIAAPVAFAAAFV